jgi:hypothetical protein
MVPICWKETYLQRKAKTRVSNAKSAMLESMRIKETYSWMSAGLSTPRPVVPALLPEDFVDRAKAREMVELINAGIQPPYNLPMVHRFEKMSKSKLHGLK